MAAGSYTNSMEGELFLRLSCSIGVLSSSADGSSLVVDVFCDEKSGG